FAPLGVAGGQTATGGTAAAENLTLSSTANATKGSIIFGTTSGIVFDEPNNRTGFGTGADVLATKVTIKTGCLTFSGTLTGPPGAEDAIAGGGGQFALFAGGLRRLVVTSDGIAGFTTPAPTFNIQSTIDATKGSIRLGVSGNNFIFDETDGNLRMGTATQVASSKLRLSADKTVASAAGAVWDGTDVIASTATISGSTSITTATGFNLSVLRAPTLSAASALTVTHAATLYIGGPPVGGGAGPATITNAYSLWVDAGQVRLDGDVGLGGLVPTGLGHTGTLTFVANLSVAPTANPAGGGVFYAEAGALKYRGSGGTVTTIAVA
ncbi:MAG: hypothetical protein ACRDKW_05905, partial [Actinomycetota bacterium]